MDPKTVEYSGYSRSEFFMLLHLFSAVMALNLILQLTPARIPPRN